MRFPFLAFMLCFIIMSCNKAKKGMVNGQEYTITPVDSSKNVIVQTSDFEGIVFDKDTETNESGDLKTFTPSPEQIFKAETILKRCVEKDRIGSDSMEIWPGALYSLDNYYRQYFGIINEKRQAVIWINCFRKSKNGELSIPVKWQRRRAFVQDGYKNFFNIYTNVSTNECYGFFRNSIGG